VQEFFNGDNFASEICQQSSPDLPKNIELPKLQHDYE